MARDPATDAVTTGAYGPVWSVTVPGCLRGDQVRVEVVGTRAYLSVRVPSWAAPSEIADEEALEAVTLRCEMPVSELRTLVQAITQWPGVVE
jgi:hypothetical protein